MTDIIIICNIMIIYNIIDKFTFTAFSTLKTFYSSPSESCSLCFTNFKSFRAWITLSLIQTSQHIQLSASGKQREIKATQRLVSKQKLRGAFKQRDGCIIILYVLFASIFSNSLLWVGWKSSTLLMTLEWIKRNIPVVIHAMLTTAILFESKNIPAEQIAQALQQIWRPGTEHCYPNY